jgi:7-carboxy-7-deazaguanine synthase
MKEIHINDLFWTLQGEGVNWGRRALFVRMPFCNLNCEWCDTAFNSKKDWGASDFLSFAHKESSRFAVITGGEPTMHKHTPFVISLLKGCGFEIAIETNGNYPIPEGIDFVTCSPKRQADIPYFVHAENFRKVSEWKYVVDDFFDFDVLSRHKEKKGVRYSLSPEFNNMQVSVNRIINFIKENPQWRLNLQTHKWIGLPARL